MRRRCSIARTIATGLLAVGLVLCVSSSVFAVNRTWVSSNITAGSYRTKWGTGFASNWTNNTAPTASDIAVFANFTSVTSPSVQAGTQVGRVTFNNTGTNSFIISGTGTLSIFGVVDGGGINVGINNLSGLQQTFSNVLIGADQTWSGVPSALIRVNSIDLNGYSLTTSTDVSLGLLSQSGATASTVTVSGGSTSVDQGDPSGRVDFVVTSGSLTMFDQAVYGDLSVSASGVYNNTSAGSVGQTTWDQVSMSSGGTIDLMGIGGSLVTNGYTQTAGTVKMYVGYDPFGVLGSSLVQATDGAGDPTGLLSFGGTLDIDFSGSAAESFGTGAGWLLFQGVVTGTTSFSSVLLDNVDPSSPYYGLTFHAAANGDFWTDASAVNGQQLVFYRNAGELVVVPEPSTIVFAGIGVAMCGWTMWRRRRLGKIPPRPVCG